jgi:hypothetical protein
MANPKDRGTTIAGITVFLGLVTGVTAFLAGLYAFIPNLDFAGAGACFIAAALGFGLTANAVLRG